MSGIISGFTQMAMSGPIAHAEFQQLNAETKGEDTNLQLRAAQAREQGAHDAMKQRLATGLLVAKQASAYRSSGVDAGVGTAAQVQANSAAVGDLDAQQLESNSARAAWGFEESRKTLQANYKAKRDLIDLKQQASLIGGAGQYYSSGASVALGFAGGGG